MKTSAFSPSASPSDLKILSPMLTLRPRSVTVTMEFESDILGEFSESFRFALKGNEEPVPCQFKGHVVSYSFADFLRGLHMQSLLALCAPSLLPTLNAKNCRCPLRRRITGLRELITRFICRAQSEYLFHSTHEHSGPSCWSSENGCRVRYDHAKPVHIHSASVPCSLAAYICLVTLDWPDVPLQRGGGGLRGGQLRLPRERSYRPHQHLRHFHDVAREGSPRRDLSKEGNYNNPLLREAFAGPERRPPCGAHEPNAKGSWTS